MKFTLIILPAFLLWKACIMPENFTASQADRDTLPDVQKINFEQVLQPILIKNCSPCHFPGGKMYERLPFDQDTTILNHHEAILKRIKNKEENTTLKKFILQNKPG